MKSELLRQRMWLGNDDMRRSLLIRRLDCFGGAANARERFKTLRLQLPLSDEEGRSRLQKLAEGFELKFYNEATNKDSYKRKIAMLLIYVKNMNRNSNCQDNRGKAPMRESSPGDKIIPQEYWDSALYDRSNEDPIYEPTDDRVTNLKKRKFDYSLGVDGPSSSLAIPGESLMVPSC